MKAKSPPLTLEVLRAKHDPRVVTRNKITRQLAALRDRKAQYQYENDLLRETSISPRHMSLVRAEFERHIAVVAEIGKKNPRTVWFPNPVDAATIRKEQLAIRKAMGSGTQAED